MLIGHFDKGQIMNAGAVGASPAVKQKLDENELSRKQKMSIHPQSQSLEEDELDIIAMAVTSELRRDDPDRSYRVVRDRKVVYESGVVKHIDPDDRDPGAIKPEEIVATPAGLDPCALKRLVSSLGIMPNCRIHLSRYIPQKLLSPWISF